MNVTEYNQRLEQTIAKIVSDWPQIKDMLGKGGAAEMFVHALAEESVNDWESGKWNGKPPWISGRMKTRGGRDQDRWRKRLREVMSGDCCWDSVPKLKLTISVNGVDDCEWLKQMEREHD